MCGTVIWTSASFFAYSCRYIAPDVIDETILLECFVATEPIILFMYEVLTLPGRALHVAYIDFQSQHVRIGITTKQNIKKGRIAILF